MSASNTRVFTKGDRLSFSQVTGPTSANEQLIITADFPSISTLFVGKKTSVSLNAAGTLTKINTGNAPLLVDTGAMRVGIGGLPTAAYTLDVSGQAHIAGNTIIEGNVTVPPGTGIFIGDGSGLRNLNLNAAATPLIIFSTTGQLASTGLSTIFIAGGLIPTSSLVGTLRTDLFGPNTIPLIALQSTGTIYATKFYGDGTNLTGISDKFSTAASTLASFTSNTSNYFGNTLLYDPSTPIIGLSNLFSNAFPSTVDGLGTAGYISSLALFSTTTGLLNAISSFSSFTGVGGGGNLIYNDAWIQSSLINPPPPLIFGTPASKTAQIFIPWTYPTQQNVGFQSNWVPVISTLNADLSTNLGFSHFFSNNNVGGFINYNTNTPYITGVVLSRAKGTSAVQQITFPQDGQPRYAYIYYSEALSNLNTSGQFTAWYANYNTGSNPASVVFQPFIQGGAPSAPQRLQYTNVTSNSAYLYFSSPSFVDTTDPTSVVTISEYNINLNSVPIAGKRYGTLLFDYQPLVYKTPIPFTTSPDSLPGQVMYVTVGLYPESTYTFTVAAKNSLGSTGPTATRTGMVTGALTPDSVAPVLQFPARYYGGTIYRVSDTLSITTLVNSSSDWTSASFLSPVHQLGNRGSSNIRILQLQTSFTSPTAVAGPTVYYNGFPASLPAAQSQSNLTITPISISDKFSTYPIQYQNYYLNSYNTVTINSASFTANASPYIFSLSVSPGGTAQTTFYYDGNPGTATVLDVTVNMSATPTKVSGINVVSGTPSLSTVTGCKNLGNYFYSSPPLQYTITSGSATATASETTLTHMTTGNTGSSLLQNQRLVFSNTLQSPSLANTFSLSLSVASVARNVLGSSSPVTGSVTAIIDGPSVSLITSTIPASLPTANTITPTVGCRLWTYTNSNVPPFTYSGTSYTTILYDHSKSLIDSSPTYSAIYELQVVNGAHTTKGTSSTSYLNYTSYLYNTLNYSGIAASGLRFATFGWKTALQLTNYTELTFTINIQSTDTLFINNNQVFFTGGTTSDKIYLFYRIEDQASLTPTDATSPTTVWLDANGTPANPASALNYYTDTTGTSTQIRGGIASGCTLQGSTLTFPSVFIPGFATPSGKDIRIIARVGVPMQWNFAFTTITALLGNGTAASNGSNVNNLPQTFGSVITF
jgi:hypothetical protein